MATYGMTRSSAHGQYPTGNEIPVASEASRRGQQQWQDQNYQQGQMESEKESRRIAGDQLFKLINTPGSYVETNGMSINANTGSGGGMGGAGGSRGGLAIGGGLFPDITALHDQLSKLNPRVPPPAHIGAPSVPSTSGAFAHAKDVAGRSGNKALEQLRNSMTARGMSDSGMETMGEANILGGVARQQSDAEYEAANTDNTRQWNANQMGYTGDLAQSQMGYQGEIHQNDQAMQSLIAMIQRLY